MTEPVLPRNAKSPLNEYRRLRSVLAKLKKALREERNWLKQMVKNIPVEEYTIQTNDAERRYEYLIDPRMLRTVTDNIKRRIESGTVKIVQDGVDKSYEVGTANEVENLQRLSDDYQFSVTQVLSSDRYQARVAYVRSRVFEEMQGFADESGRRLGRILGDGIEAGKSPLKVTKEIQKEFGETYRRAERIARTEMGQAQRRGGWDEADDAESRLNVLTKEMHLSALSPTSRDNHIARHGRVYAREVVREWFSSTEGINCKCDTVSVLVDENGNIRSDRAVNKAKATKKRMGF